MLNNRPAPIYFHFLERISLNHRTELKSFIQSLFKKEGKQLGSLHYIFCSDKYLLEINKQYLAHDYYTDIITFDLSETSGVISGEVYISTDRVRDNAQNFNATFTLELHRVIFHGALHLCGYRDKTKKETMLMRQKEDHYLGAYRK